VHHRGELLGALSLTKPQGERLTPAEEHLAGDLASGAGLVLRIVRLTEELLARFPLVEELVADGSIRMEKRGSRWCWATRIYVATGPGRT